MLKLKLENDFAQMMVNKCKGRYVGVFVINAYKAPNKAKRELEERCITEFQHTEGTTDYHIAVANKRELIIVFNTPDGVRISSLDYDLLIEDAKIEDCEICQK